jgi:hypothetical protein
MWRLCAEYLRSFEQEAAEGAESGRSRFFSVLCFLCFLLLNLSFCKKKLSGPARACHRAGAAVRGACECGAIPLRTMGTRPDVVAQHDPVVRLVSGWRSASIWPWARRFSASRRRRAGYGAATACRRVDPARAS